MISQSLSSFDLSHYHYCSFDLLAFRALLDNYKTETGFQEEVTEKERIENWQFLDAIMETELMQEAQQFLVQNGKAPEDPEEFKELLYKLWFKLYKRSRHQR